MAINSGITIRKTAASLLSGIGKSDVTGGSMFDTITQGIAGIRSAREAGHNDVICAVDSFTMLVMAARHEMS